MKRNNEVKPKFIISQGVRCGRWSQKEHLAFVEGMNKYNQ